MFKFADTEEKIEIEKLQNNPDKFFYLLDELHSYLESDSGWAIEETNTNLRLILDEENDGNSESDYVLYNKNPYPGDAVPVDQLWKF